MTGLHHALAPMTRGCGAILAFHHVRPAMRQAFAPNRGLEITPGFLDAVLGWLQRRNYAVVPLGDVPRRLADDRQGRFVALTFDDGYRDTLDHALPVLERHTAPFTVFVTTGFAERKARLWWLELEQAIAKAETLRIAIDGVVESFPTARIRDKHRVFDHVARHLRQAPPEAVQAALDSLGRTDAAGRSLVETLCLDWEGIAQLAAHPLATLGCHTLSHPCLAALDDAALRHELSAARAITEARIDRPVHHLAYPFGGHSAAGRREFAMAEELGFATAVTTRPGVVRPADAARLTALPRLSVNGLWPHLDAFDILLSGAPFALNQLLGR